MIRARHTLAGELVAGLYAGPLLDRAFREVRIVGEAEDDGLPVLMLANHFCWWDGFIQHRINRSLFHRRLHVMMLEEQLKKHPILAQCGCFSVRKNSRSMLRSLDYCLDILHSPGNMLLLFPQGRIESIHVPAPGFESGIGYLLDRIGGEYGIVLDINLPDYGAGRKPALNCYLRILRSAEVAGTDTLRAEWNRFYTECKERQIAAL